MIAYFVLIFSTSYELLISSLFVIGAMCTVRVQVSVVYLYEIFTRADYKTMYTVVCMFEGVAGVAAALYFKFVSKDSQGLMLIALAMMAVGTVACWFFPESPRYLIKRDRISCAKDVIEQIARWNSRKSPGSSYMDEMFAIRNKDDEIMETEPLLNV